MNPKNKNRSENTKMTVKRTICLIMACLMILGTLATFAVYLIGR